MNRRIVAGLLFGSALILAGCVQLSPPAPIPPPMAEAIPNPPVSPVPLMWQPGHWDWTGNSFVWTPGQYVAVRRPRRHLDARLVAADRLRLGLAAGALGIRAAGASAPDPDQEAPPLGTPLRA